jgi:hypothetical protein
MGCFNLLLSRVGAANLIDALPRQAEGGADLLQPRPQGARFGDGGIAFAARRDLRQHLVDALALPASLGGPRNGACLRNGGADHVCAPSLWVPPASNHKS